MLVVVSIAGCSAGAGRGTLGGVPLLLSGLCVVFDEQFRGRGSALSGLGTLLLVGQRQATVSFPDSPWRRPPRALTRHKSVASSERVSCKIARAAGCCWGKSCAFHTPTLPKIHIMRTLPDRHTLPHARMRRSSACTLLPLSALRTVVWPPALLRCVFSVVVMTTSETPRDRE